MCHASSAPMASAASPMSTSNRRRPTPSDGPSAHRLAGPGGAIVVGQDTRRSGDMFVAAIAAGATSLGVDVHVVGVVPTPALAFLAGSGQFAAGIMVSASHNPADDNGLKVLDGDGLKLDDEVEDELEQLIWRTEELGGVAQRRPRPDRSTRTARLDAYRAHRLAMASLDRRRRAADRPRRRERLGIGASARTILGATGARLEVIHADPDGANINVRAAPPPRVRWPRPSSPGAPMSGSRSTATPTGSSRSMRPGASSMATRSSASSPSTGWPAVRCRVAGSSCRSCRTAASRRSSRRPAGRSCARRSATSTSSRGCRSRGAVLGGEKSGHVIVLEHTTSGDGIVTALEVLRVMGRAARRLAELAADDPAPAPATAGGQGASQGPVGRRPGPPAGHRRGDGPAGRPGRILVRPSGTEPALRVMVEGPDEALVQRAGRLARGPRRGATRLAPVPTIGVTTTRGAAGGHERRT